ncbi:MAG: DUF4386 family protein [Chloroflexi bacterium]|nr:DUF4386 family protein [Chloroflexota bacterium]
MTNWKSVSGNSGWEALYRAGGVAALVAGVIFRRNIGAEVDLFTAYSFPTTVSQWFELLHDSPLAGVAFLGFFDVVDYLLVGVMFLALGAVLWPAGPSGVVVAAACGLVGITTSFGANVAFPMLTLSQQYAAAASPAERTALLDSGRAVLALNPSQEIFQGTGAYLSLLLIALAGLIFSLLMLRSGLFNRGAAWTGILASACDLIYCVSFIFAPFLKIPLLASGGLLLMIWHLLTGWRLLQLARPAAGGGRP